jgi:hypothetical protein
MAPDGTEDVKQNSDLDRPDLIWYDMIYLTAIG